MPEQTEIGGDQVGDPNLVPEGQECEWRHDEPTPATIALPLKRKMRGGKRNATVDTGMRKYACEQHRKVAEEQCGPPLDALRKK
jgi:hypothetical protein